MLPCFFCRFDEAVLALQGRQPAIDIIIEIGRLQIAQLLPLLGSDDHGSSSHSPAIPSPFRPQGIIIRESNNQIILHISLRMDFETSPTLPALRKSFCFLLMVPTSTNLSNSVRTVTPPVLLFPVDLMALATTVL